jgi:hypothetical protein
MLCHIMRMHLRTISPVHFIAPGNVWRSLFDLRLGSLHDCGLCFSLLYMAGLPEGFGIEYITILFGIWS